jgi:general secretion pathway protein L
VNLKDLLNADLRTVGQWAREGVSWWLDELASMAPAGLRRRSARPSLVAELRADGGFRLTQDGAPVAFGPGGPAKPVDLVLPAGEVLVREMELPLLSAKDTRRMVALDLERLSPMPAEAIFFDTEIVARDEVGRRQSLVLGVIQRQTALAALETAQAAGLAPAAIGVAGPGGEGRRFDFLPAVRHASGERTPVSRMPLFWAVTLGLLVLNLIVLIMRDSADVAAMRRVVESQRPAVDAAQRIRKRVGDETARREALVRRRIQSEPLRLINAVTLLMPPGAWVQRLEASGRTVRVVGYKPPAVDLMGSFRSSPLFANPRSQTVDVSAPGANGTQPFDIIADVRRVPGA